MFEWKKYRFSENGLKPPFSCDAAQLIKGFRRSRQLHGVLTIREKRRIFFTC